MVGTDATTIDHHPRNWRRRRHLKAIAARPLLAWLVVLGVACCDLRLSSAQAPSDYPIRASGDTVYRWQIGAAQASLLEGDCVVQHDDRSIRARSVLLVSDGPRGAVRTRIVVDGMLLANGRRRDEPTALTLMTHDDPEIQSPLYRGAPKKTPTLLKYLPGDQVNAGGSAAVEQVQLQQVQFQQPLESPGLLEGGATPLLDSPVLSTAQGVDLSAAPTVFPDGATTRGTQFFVGGGTQSVEIIARSGSMPPELSTINRPETAETVITARGGVTVLIRDVSMQLSDGRLIELGTISLSADRIVAWMPIVTDLISGDADFSQADGELYLEGDIVFRQGQRIIYAERMYYNVAQGTGMVLDAEAITTIPEYQGIVRLKADVLQQVAKGNFIAFDAAVTTSRLGVPRYWLQSQRLSLTDRVRTTTDPLTGRPVLSNEPFAKSSNNFVYFGGVPILYWPRFSTSLERPAYYLSGVKVKNDRAFGTGLLLDWDLFQLFGIDSAPRGVDWELSTDYLSDRGPALGTKLEYRLPGLLGIPGPVNGFFDTWVIDDRGNDRLGSDRIDLPPEKSTRGRSLWRHRHHLPRGFEFIAELGWLSDRNFLEQYFENEWDRETDHTTGLRLRNYYYNNLFEVSANVQINDFFTETENLPSLDHYLLGGSLFGNRMTWSTHNRVGYSKLNVADTPKNTDEALEYSPIPGEFDRRGVVASTRHELALPVSTGPFRFVPFVSGEAAHYGEAVDGDSLTRLLGQAGMRASLPMSRIDPTIQSSLLNVRGLAHKLEWTAEYFYADSDTDLDELPLYDALDDNAQEQFRRRFIKDLYGGALPMQFDPRYYALRHGLQRSIVSPSDVIADDLQQFRIGLHQRFQTKRGLPGRERIVDLLQLDVDMLLFPDADRDNFGETVGPTIYTMRYHIGDRFTLLSDGYFDFFTDGLRSISAGLRASRPGVGDWYMGLLSLEGPINSTVLRSSIDYRLNEKWIFSGGTTYDFGQTGNVGQSLGVTRIGESLLVRLGVNVDSGRDNVGVGFSVEPRFWPSQRLGRIGGHLIPPPGAQGLE